MNFRAKSYGVALMGAAAVLALASCGGGGEESAPTGADISPHQFVMDGQQGGMMTIRGIIIPNTGWEIGSTPDEGLDPTESMLTLTLMPDGTMELAVPASSIADNPDAPARNPRVEGTWSQPEIGMLPNNLYPLNFQCDDTDYGIQYRGRNIRMHIFKVTPDESMDHESPIYIAQKEASPDAYTYTGYIVDGRFTIEYKDVVTQGATSGKPMFVDIQIIGQPAVYMTQF
ncbi:MAG: hypothetical protein Q4F30_01315 [Akkermansia sp.]|nr:hypothetical protein [Akkermansia sp.]